MDLVTLFLAIYRSHALKNNGDEALVYGLFTLILLFAGKFVSDGAFSAIVTVGAAVQCLGFCLLRLKMRKQKGVAGISSRTLQCFLVAYCFRLYSTLQYNGYLPVDRSGDWVYQAIEVSAVLVIVSILVAMHSRHEASYERSVDTCDLRSLLALCVLLATVLHPGLNNRRVADICWTAGLFVESISMVPQLYMMTRAGGEVESLASHYIACVFLSRLLMVGFWVNSYPELRPKGADYNWPGAGVMGAQILQLILICDFMKHYLRSLRTASKLVLPRSLAV